MKLCEKSERVFDQLAAYQKDLAWWLWLLSSSQVQSRRGRHPVQRPRTQPRWPRQSLSSPYHFRFQQPPWAKPEGQGLGCSLSIPLLVLTRSRPEAEFGGDGGLCYNRPYFCPGLGSRGCWWISTWKIVKYIDDLTTLKCNLYFLPPNDCCPSPFVVSFRVYALDIYLILSEKHRKYQVKSPTLVRM